MTNQSIGEMAGKVWHELNENGEMTAAKLKTKLKSGGNQYHREKLNKLLENIEQHQANP